MTTPDLTNTSMDSLIHRVIIQGSLGARDTLIARIHGEDDFAVITKAILEHLTKYLNFNGPETLYQAFCLGAMTRGIALAVGVNLKTHVFEMHEYQSKLGHALLAFDGGLQGFQMNEIAGFVDASVYHLSLEKPRFSWN